MVPDTTVGRIATLALSSGDAALTNPTALQERATTPVPLVAYACPVRPRHAAIDWVRYDSAIVLVAHDPVFTAEQAVDLVARAIGHPVVLAGSGEA